MVRKALGSRGGKGGMVRGRCQAGSELAQDAFHGARHREQSLDLRAAIHAVQAPVAEVLAVVAGQAVAARRGPGLQRA